MPPLHVITGAFGYTGSFVCAHIWQRHGPEGCHLRTITNSPGRKERVIQAILKGTRSTEGLVSPELMAAALGAVEVCKMDFADHEELVNSLRGAEVLYNTYWVRFDHTDAGKRLAFSHGAAVENTRALFAAASEAGVKRIVHISISNPDKSQLPYFEGKMELERALAQTGIEFVILRPAVLFGAEDILLNNIAWSVRHFPFTPIPGSGNYRLQPIHVNDLAQLMVERGCDSSVNFRPCTIDAVGPETYTFRELNDIVGRTVNGSCPWILPVPHVVMVLFGKIFGLLLDDEILTADEVAGLTSDLLAAPGAPVVGQTRLSEWLVEHKKTLGTRYASELARRRDRNAAYSELYQGMPFGSARALVIISIAAGSAVLWLASRMLHGFLRP